MAKSEKHTGKGLKISAEPASPLEQALLDASDIVIILNNDHVISDIHVSKIRNSLGDLDHWRSQPIDKLLTEESIPKLKKRLSGLSAKDPDAPAIIEINHIDDNEREFPVRYTIRHAAEDNGYILVGRDLRATADVQQQLVKAQIALEKQYEKHRDFDTRYRVLRDNVCEAVIIVDASTGRILDTNINAAKLFRTEAENLTGLSVNSIFKNKNRRPALESLLNDAAESDPPPLTVSTTQSNDILKVTPTLFRSAGDMMLLCRLTTEQNAAPQTGRLTSSLDTLYRTGPDAIVFTDAKGIIRHANSEFLTLCDVVQAAHLKEKTLADFLYRGTIDQKILLETALQSGRIKNFSTRLRSTNGGEIGIEVSACYLEDQTEPYFGFVFRNRTRTEMAAEPPEHSTDATQNAMELVGTAPLKELVAATADVVEKLCIETAVKLTDNNRVAAAELLGLSRQSFYVRLRKYGLLKQDED